MTDLFDRMRQNPQGDWTITDVEKLCRAYDVRCEPPRGGGSHYKIYHQEMADILTVPFKRPIKAVYIRKLIAFVAQVRNNHGPA